MDATITLTKPLVVFRWGFLVRGVSFSKNQKRQFYQPVHAAWSEYAAGVYLASVSHYSNILQREIYSLPLDAQPCLLTSAGIHRSALQVPSPFRRAPSVLSDALGS